MCRFVLTLPGRRLGAGALTTVGILVSSFPGGIVCLSGSLCTSASWCVYNRTMSAAQLPTGVGVAKPYFQTARQFVDDQYSEGGRWLYLRHPDFAALPINYVRTFELIQKDLLLLFESIEPADQNLNTFSLRTFELLLRTCTEFEANCKSIFRANTYAGAGNWNITDYVKINKSHYLSQFEVRFPHWMGTKNERTPFAAWDTGTHVLPWYQAYNKAKHDRATNLEHATLDNLLDAFAGLAVILTAQFLDQDYGPGADVLEAEFGPGDGFEGAIGGYLRVKYPQQVPMSDRYDFNWEQLKNDAEPFERFDYNAV